MAEQKIGEFLDSSGISFDLDDGDFITGAVVLAKIVDPNGGVALGIANTDGCSWLEQLGLITAADHVIRTSNPLRQVGDDEC